MDAWHNVAGGGASWNIRTDRSDEGGEEVRADVTGGVEDLAEHER